MRNLALITGLALTLLTLHACTLESTPDPGKAMSDVSADVNAEGSASSEEATADASLGTTTDAVITPASCSVTLNFCDRPNSSIGTDCTETGCTLSAAVRGYISLQVDRGFEGMQPALQRRHAKFDRNHHRYVEVHLRWHLLL